MKRFRRFFFTRTLSAVGDEMWLTAMPIFLAGRGLSTMQMGSVQSMAAMGTIAGFLLVPKLCRHFKTSIVALISDIVQIVAFLGLASVFHFRGVPTSPWFWGLFGLILSVFTASWFAATETFLSNNSTKEEAQDVHRWNFLASNAGPVAGPSLGGIFFQFGGIISVVIFNVISFTGQMFSLFSLSKQEPAVEVPHAEKKTSFVSGLAALLKSKAFVSMSFLPMIVKLSLLGVLPFVPFVLSKAGNSGSTIGVLLSLFTVGSLLGALSFKSGDSRRLGVRLFIDSSLMMVATCVLIAGLKFELHFAFLAMALFCGGIFSARYTIEIRAMRQLIIPKNQMATLVSSMGLLVRLVTPLAPIMWGFFYAPSTEANKTLLALVAILGAALAATIVFKNAYETCLRNQEASA